MGLLEGVVHSEFNGSDAEPVHFFQIWIMPERDGITPGYEQKLFPDEERRNHALEQGMASPTKTPGVWLALAAGWSGGSMMGPDAPPVPPPPYLTARAVNAGVLSVLGSRLAMRV